MTAVRVAAVVPAYNEVQRVGAVVESLLASPRLSAVLVVDDGSNDATTAAALQAGAAVLRMPRNVGKGGAMLAGVRAVPWADAVLFVDGDLTGFTPAHVETIVEPLQGGSADMAVGRLDGWDDTKALRLGGQRAVLRWIPLSTSRLGSAGYGAEVVLTQRANNAGARTVLVPLPGVGNYYKSEKYGLAGGVVAGVRMRMDVARATAGSGRTIWALLGVVAAVAAVEVWG